MAEEDERLILEWTADDTRDLIDKVEAKIPKNDRISFAKRISRLDWTGITVADYSSDECRAQWDRIVGNVRTFRLLAEVVEDIKTWANDPTRQPKGREHSDFPKMPPASYFRFSHEKYQKLKSRHPDLSAADLHKKLKKRWDNLSEEERAVYNNAYQEEMKDFNQRKAQFYEKHPEYVHAPKKKESKKRKNAEGKVQGPALPKTPFDHFAESRIPAEEPEADRRAQKEALKSKWASISDKRKLKYIEKSLEDEKRYKEELAVLTAAHPEFVSKRHKRIVTKDEQNVLAEAYGRPKQPHGTSGYTLFCSDFQKSDTTEKPAGGLSWIIDASKAWKKLTDTAKKEYNERVKTLWMEYKKACEVYLADLSEERRDEERKILGYDEISASTNGVKKRRKKEFSENGQTGLKKRRVRAGSDATAAPTGRSFFMMEKWETFKKLHPGVDDSGLKKLISLAFGQLPKEQQSPYEAKAEQIARMGG